MLVTLPEVREAIITPISDDILQFIPSYHISLYSDNINYEEFEKKLEVLIITNIGKSALPGKIEYTSEPLLRMTNSKIDIEYYKNQDMITDSNVKKLIK